MSECRRVTEAIFADQSSTKLNSMRCEDLSVRLHRVEVNGVEYLSMFFVFFANV